MIKTIACLCVSTMRIIQDDNKVERTFGDCSVRKRYSHIDLLQMIDAVDMQRATAAAGNRCYFMKVCETMQRQDTIV